MEGFYGRPWNPRQRHQLFKWLQAGGLNTYFYAPKDDVKHRACWRELYDEAEAAELGALIRDCHRHGLRFFYGLAPGLDLRFSAPDDLAALRAKTSQLLDLGCRHFAVLFDDIPAQLSIADAARFGSPAQAQCTVTNDVFVFVRAKCPDSRFLFCPTVYCGRMALPSVLESSYLREVGQRLAPEIAVLWTGPEIVSESIPIESIRELRAVLRRLPVIWDNLLANDYDARRLCLGPYSGRPPELCQETGGILVNPNCQFEADFVAVKTLALSLAHTGSLTPRAAYLQALEEWLPWFVNRGHQAVTREDLILLGDVFYLPFAFGERAQAYLDDFGRLLRASPEQWGKSLERFAQTSRDILRMFDKMTALQNRELLHALYQHLWELKELVLLLQAWVRWRQGNPAPDQQFSTPEFRPKVYRGGLVATFERLFPMDDQGRFSPALSPRT